MKIAITGARGQLGRELHRMLSLQHEILPLARPQYDVTQNNIIEKIVGLKPNLVIHAAAMTDVDECARNPKAAFRVNALGTRNVALGCQQAHAAMLYISTNEVFNGNANVPYRERCEPDPINGYGKSKLQGERHVRDILKHAYIVRTAWLFAREGNNFPKKIIDAAKKAGNNSTLRVVDDEIGNPTYVPDLAQAITRLIMTRRFRIYHLTNQGLTSRYDFAVTILKMVGLNVPIEKMKLADYKRDSTPPPFSALENFAAATILEIKLRNWKVALKDYAAQIKDKDPLFSLPPP